MNFKDFFKINRFNKILITLAGLVVLFSVFTAGIFVGFEKARFSYRWGENYYNNIIGRRDPLNPDRQFFNAHNVVGKILKIDGNNIIIKDQYNNEKTIAVDDKTVIRARNQTMKISDLKVDNDIVVIGSPNNQGQIEAKLIRVMLPGDNLLPPPFGDMMLPAPQNN